MVNRDRELGWGWDVVGDIHGNFSALQRLLGLLGYRKEGGSWRASHGRKLIFAGDLIDRGSDVLQVLRTVRDLEQSGVAHVVMGNHEYNFICYNEKFDSDRAPEGGFGSDGWLRSHSEEHRLQHLESITAFSQAPQECQSHLKWLQKLPILADFGGLRVVHAAWLPPRVERLREMGWNRTIDGAQFTGVDLDFIHRSWGSWRHPQQSEEFILIENLIKGPEAPLPDGWFYRDKLGTQRHRARLRWWLSSDRPLPRSWRELAILPAGLEPPFEETSLESGLFQEIGYPDAAPPVVVGHYWQTGIEDAFWSSKVACVDWSTARGGPLAAYRWSGESELIAQHFISVQG